MHQVTLLGGNGKRLVVDFDELRLDSGERARDYPEPADLYRKLQKMRVPEIEVGMGTYQLLVCLGRHRAASAPVSPVHKREPSIGDAA
jgi:hypothetical protein